jgi:hypothetical protein
MSSTLLRSVPFDDRLLGLGVGQGLGRRQEPGADQRPGRAQRERGGHAPPVGASAIGCLMPNSSVNAVDNAMVTMVLARADVRAARVGPELRH